MIARILMKPFGSVWKLKHYCLQGKNRILVKFAKLLYEVYQYENNSSIAWNSSFSSEPCFPHGMKSIFISGGANIGSNCIIFQQVTIGSSSFPDSKNSGAPHIGKNVFIGAGAKIIGGIKIGDNVRIGANTVVYQNVPDNSVVISGKQQTITKSAPIDNKFYSFHGKWVYFENGLWKPVTETNILEKLSGL
mgnify:FL=1